MNHFYVTLPCDSSMTSFPKNTVAQYTTKLPDRIQLDGDYEVALVDFIYPWSFRNFRNANKNDPLTLTINETIGGTVEIMRDIFEFTIPDGYYESESDFVKVINTKIASKIRSDPHVDDLVIEFTFDKPTRKLGLHLECESNIKMYMTDNLRMKLGFRNWGLFKHGYYEAADSFDLNAGQRLMYVYCDLASYVYVGSIKSPLLRICNTSGKYGETIRDTFTRPFYVPISRREFDTILIDIRDELGKPMPFEFGKSVVTLHFRRRHSLISSS